MKKILFAIKNYQYLAEKVLACGDFERWHQQTQKQRVDQNSSAQIRTLTPNTSKMSL